MLAAAAALFAPLRASAAPQKVPANDGWVTDLADLLSPAKEAELEALMESYRNGSGHELALLTVPSLEGGAIEEFALRVGRAWGIGDAERQAGALLVIAALERRTRIEVGRGLEGSLTDAVAGRVLRNVLAPRFRAGDYEGGIDAAIRALHAAAGGDYGPIERSASESDRAADWVMFAVVAAFVILAMHQRGRGPRAWRGGYGGFGPIVIGRTGSFGGRSSGGFGGFGGGGGFSGGGASGGW